MPRHIHSNIDKTKTNMVSLDIEDLSAFDIVSLSSQSGNGVIERLFLFIKPTLVVSIDSNLSITSLANTHVIKIEGSLDLSTNIRDWPPTLCAAFLLGKLASEVGFYPGMPAGNVNSAIAKFSSHLVNLVRDGKTPICSNRTFKEYKYVLTMTRRGTPFSLKVSTTQARKPSKSAARKLRRKFHEEIRKKRWTVTSKKAGVNLPISSIQIKKLLSEKIPGVQTKLSNVVIRSAEQLKKVVNSENYPNVIILSKENREEFLFEIPGYVVIDCSNLPKHFASKDLGDYYLLIKRGYNICNAADSVDPCWVYGVGGTSKKEVLLCQNTNSKIAEAKNVYRSYRGGNQAGGQPPRSTGIAIAFH